MIVNIHWKFFNQYKGLTILKLSSNKASSESFAFLMTQLSSAFQLCVSCSNTNRWSASLRGVFALSAPALSSNPAVFTVMQESSFQDANLHIFKQQKLELLVRPNYATVAKAVVSLLAFLVLSYFVPAQCSQGLCFTYMYTIVTQLIYPRSSFQEEQRSIIMQK